MKLAHTRKTHHIKATNQYGKARQSTMDILRQIDDEVLDRIKYHLRHELVLYAYALSLIVEQYSRIVETSVEKYRERTAAAAAARKMRRKRRGDFGNGAMSNRRR